MTIRMPSVTRNASNGCNEVHPRSLRCAPRSRATHVRAPGDRFPARHRRLPARRLEVAQHAFDRRRYMSESASAPAGTPPPPIRWPHSARRSQRRPPAARRRHSPDRESARGRAPRTSARRAGRSRAARAPLSTRSGQASAYASGVRMSGDPIWARTEPSGYSTIEWTTLCGWITTSIRSAGMPNSQLRLDHLEPLVHQRGGIDRDLAAHHPVRDARTLRRA